MVRTRANPAAARKAVAAKAPRKTLVSARSTASSPSSSSKKKSSGAGNPLKVWPTPSWQKGLEAFMGSVQVGGESSGCSSKANPSLLEDGLVPGEPHTTGSSGAEVGSSTSDIQLLSDDITQLNSDSDDD